MLHNIGLSHQNHLLDTTKQCPAILVSSDDYEDDLQLIASLFVAECCDADVPGGKESRGRDQSVAVLAQQTAQRQAEDTRRW